MGGDEDLDRSAAAYWMGLARAGTPKPQTRAKAKPEKTEMPNESELTDPLVLIVQAIRDNSDAIKAATMEMTTARNAMAEAERKAALRADAMSSDLRSNTLAVQQLTASQARIVEAENAKHWWGLGGVLGGMVVLEALTLLWHNFFG